MQNYTNIATHLQYHCYRNYICARNLVKILYLYLTIKLESSSAYAIYSFIVLVCYTLRLDFPRALSLFFQKQIKIGDWKKMKKNYTFLFLIN